MSTDLQPLSRLELVVENLKATLEGIDGVVGVSAEEPPEDGPGSYLQSELPHIWFFEQGETVKSSNASWRCTQSFVFVLIYRCDGDAGVNATGRRFMALMQKALSADPQRGEDDNHLSRAQDTRETGSFIGTLPERGHGAARLEEYVEYLRGVTSPFKREG